MEPLPDPQGSANLDERHQGHLARLFEPFDGGERHTTPVGQVLLGHVQAEAAVAHGSCEVNPPERLPRNHAINGYHGIHIWRFDVFW